MKKIIKKEREDKIRKEKKRRKREQGEIKERRRSDCLKK